MVTVTGPENNDQSPDSVDQVDQDTATLMRSFFDDPENFWPSLSERFDEASEFLKRAVLEDKESAIGFRFYFDDDDTGAAYHHEDVIAFRESNNHDDLSYYLGEGRSLINELQHLFGLQELTPRLLMVWGNFLFCYGYVFSAWSATKDDLDRVRDARKGGQAVRRKAQMKWVAKLLHREMGKGYARKVAEGFVADRINKFIAAGMFPDGFDQKWFRHTLMTDKGFDRRRSLQPQGTTDRKRYSNILCASYTQSHLSEAQIESLSLEPDDDIPSLDIPIPKP